MNDSRKTTRFGVFKQVLVDASKRRLSPAYTAYLAATSDAERGHAFANMTADDRDEIFAAVTRTMDAQKKDRAVAHRAADSKSVSNSAANETRLAIAYAVNEALPPAAQRRAKTRHVGSKIAYSLGTGILFVHICLFLIGNVVTFVGSLIHEWFVWCFLFGLYLSLTVIFVTCSNWRRIVSVLKAFPAAINAAFTVKSK